MFTSPPLFQLSTYYLVAIVPPVLVSMVPQDTVVIHDLISILAPDTACYSLVSAAIDPPLSSAIAADVCLRDFHATLRNSL